MRKNACVAAIALVAVGLLGACGGTPPTKPSTPAATVTSAEVASVALTGAAPAVGATSQFTATATLSDGTTRAVTADASWQSSNPSVITVSSTGLATGVAAGKADITATYQQVPGTLPVAVAAPGATISSVVVSGTAPEVGRSSQFKATATLSDSTTQDVTAQATWKSSNMGVAAVYASGLLTGVTTGEADITAEFQKVTGSSHVVIQAATPTPLPTPACVFRVTPNPVYAWPEGATGTIAVTVVQGSNCSWTAVSYASWVSLTPTSGTGNGTVQYVITANSLTAMGRETNVVIAGTGVTVVQQEYCVPTLSATSAHFSAAGGKGTVAVTLGGGCAWGASTQASFVFIGQPPHYVGSATVEYIVDPNPSASPRTATLSVAGKTFTITQDAMAPGICAFLVGYDYICSAAAGDSRNISVTVTLGTGCAWTAASDDSWVTLTPAAGTGKGSVQYVAAPNPTLVRRTTTLTIAGHSIAVDQEPRALTISPDCANFPAAGGTGEVAVTTAYQAISWNVSVPAGSSYITFEAPLSRVGSSTLRYTVAANTTSAPRSVDISIWGMPVAIFTIYQAGAPSQTLLSGKRF